MPDPNQSRWSVASGFSWVLVAGLAGGAAEVLWVALYTAADPHRGVAIARAVTETVFGGPVGGGSAAAIGIGIHFALSFVVAAGFAAVLYPFLRQSLGRAGVVAGAVGALVAIWIMNFMVILPVVNAEFVTLLPPMVTIVSKGLFGLCMGAVLSAAPSPREASPA